MRARKTKRYLPTTILRTRKMGGTFRNPVNPENGWHLPHLSGVLASNTPSQDSSTSRWRNQPPRRRRSDTLKAAGWEAACRRRTCRFVRGLSGAVTNAVHASCDCEPRKRGHFPTGDRKKGGTFRRHRRWSAKNWNRQPKRPPCRPAPTAAPPPGPSNAPRGEPGRSAHTFSPGLMNRACCCRCPVQSPVAAAPVFQIRNPADR